LIYDTGKYQASYGEGAYVGSDSSSNYEHVVIGNVISHTNFNGGITAEHIDVKEGASGMVTTRTEWARSATQAAAAKGILDGYLDGTLRPQRTVSRSEMAAMLSKAEKWEACQHLSFSDDVRIPAWAKSYVEAVHEDGLMQGREGNQFVPDGLITRAEAAVVFLRFWKTLYQCQTV
jgi:hypothetical protein